MEVHMNIIHYLNEISFTEMLAYALFLLAAILGLLLVAWFVAWFVAYNMTKHKMEEKEKPVIDHIDIQA